MILGSGAYLMLIPDRLVIKLMDFVRENDDVLIFRVEKFKDVYLDILDECSIADTSEDTDGCLGQG